MKPARAISLALALLAAGEVPAEHEDLTRMDLVTLMNMDVVITSAARREQTGGMAPAAAFVITREDIRRSGATSVPDLLRMVPGIHVARITHQSWAVSARGFNSRVANKLQVLIDGRSIYTPIYGGVMWEEQHVFLDDIERIEVVRGPGGALWGINAVNGVINIITRRAGGGPGLLVSMGGGNVEQAATALRYSGSNQTLGNFRMHVEHFERQPLDGPGLPWNQSQVGGSIERDAWGGRLTFQANYGDNEHTDTRYTDFASLPADRKSGAIMTSWRSATTALGEMEVRAHYGWADRHDPGTWDESVSGLDVQYDAARQGRHLLTAGLGWRHHSDHLDSAFDVITFSRERLSHDQWNLYAQDEIHFLRDDLRVILGAKLERFELTGFEIQPTARALWRLSETHTVWSAVSRAARAPSRLELHARITSPGAPTPGAPFPVQTVLVGDENLEPEDLRAYEIGWRWRPAARLSLDLAAFRHEYRSLIQTHVGAPQFDPGPPPLLQVASEYSGDGSARVSGVEAAVEWRAHERLRLQASGTLLDIDHHDDAQGGFQLGPQDSEYSGSLRARIDLPRGIELDLAWRAVGEIDATDIDAYRSLGARVGWRPLDSLEFSVAVENLLDDGYIEFFDEVAQAPGSVIGRNVFARVIWQPHRHH